MALSFVVDGWVDRDYSVRGCDESGKVRVRVDVFHREAPAEFTAGLVLKLEGVLQTPSHEVVVHGSDDRATLRVGVFSEVQDVRVFGEDGPWVERVVIVVAPR
ncbi:hypothetical protein VSH64_07325 [Amycolatopsis rhabdoformis]|uniref:Single-stranded DNA-binding protein n=1 Tax=Amycolatopsis rhabdoformis TaxID=1448059 RepID=A0ABZ1IBS1_9PSEU|nr:hypothetical protein [Amycolatopsis rhabdoformis]WSE31919.1 hypothetical protein VSH64_07325 [Amycolatopsis rhabdoformis]